MPFSSDPCGSEPKRQKTQKHQSNSTPGGDRTHDFLLSVQSETLEGRRDIHFATGASTTPTIFVRSFTLDLSFYS